MDACQAQHPFVCHQSANTEEDSSKKEVALKIVREQEGQNLKKVPSDISMAVKMWVCVIMTAATSPIQCKEKCKPLLEDCAQKYLKIR